MQKCMTRTGEFRTQPWLMFHCHEGLQNLTMSGRSERHLERTSIHAASTGSAARSAESSGSDGKSPGFTDVG